MSATSYRVTWKPSSTSENMTVTDTTAVITSLDTGVPYDITVVAINAFAESGEATIRNEYTSK